MFGLGDIIRKIRKEKSLTFDQLHDLTGLSKTTLCNIENGANFEKRTLEKIAKGLKIEISEIYSRLEQINGGIAASAAHNLIQKFYVCQNPGHAKIHGMLDDILNKAAPAIQIGIVSNIVFMRGRIKPGEQLPKEIDELKDITLIPDRIIANGEEQQKPGIEDDLFINSSGRPLSERRRRR